MSTNVSEFKYQSKGVGIKTALKAINTDQQLERLTVGIYHYFSTVYEYEGKFRVALVSMDSDKYISGFVSFFPSNEGPRSTIDSLRNKQCGFTLAAKNK